MIHCLAWHFLTEMTEEISMSDNKFTIFPYLYFRKARPSWIQITTCLPLPQIIRPQRIILQIQPLHCWRKKVHFWYFYWWHNTQYTIHNTLTFTIHNTLYNLQLPSVQVPNQEALLAGRDQITANVLQSLILLLLLHLMPFPPSQLCGTCVQWVCLTHEYLFWRIPSER